MSLAWTSSQIPKKREDVFFGSKRGLYKAMIKYNEDRIITEPPLFAVLDGHGGRKIGIEAEKLVRKKLGERPWTRSGETEEQGLTRIFREIDEELYDRINTMSCNKDKIIDDWRSGCTCTVAAIATNRTDLLCASIGDSQLFAFEYDEVDGTYKNTFSSPLDAATDPVEIARVRKAGGKVYGTRVGGRLAMSRAFGDFDLEKKNNPFSNKPRSYPKRMIVSAVPHVYTLPLESKSGKEVWWVLASDGLWDIADADNIAEMIDEIRETYSHLSWQDKLAILHTLLPSSGNQKIGKWIKTTVGGKLFLPPLYDEDRAPPEYPHDDRSIIIFVTNLS